MTYSSSQPRSNEPRSCGISYSPSVSSCSQIFFNHLECSQTSPVLSDLPCLLLYILESPCMLLNNLIFKCQVLTNKFYFLFWSLYSGLYCIFSSGLVSSPFVSCLVFTNLLKCTDVLNIIISVHKCSQISSDVQMSSHLVSLSPNIVFSHLASSFFCLVSNVLKSLCLFSSCLISSFHKSFCP